MPADVAARLTAMLAPAVPIVRPGSAETGPHIIVHAPTDSEHRTTGLCGAAADARDLWVCVCVNNTEAGALLLARRVEQALNGWMFEGCPVRLITTSSPGMDEKDPTEWRWSFTVVFSHWRNHG